MARATLVGKVQNAFVEYFRCPMDFAAFETSADLSTEEGYFKFAGTLCYGRCAGAVPEPQSDGQIPELAAGSAGSALPFDLSEIVTNLRTERYLKNAAPRWDGFAATSTARKTYYAVRPILPVALRKHLQRIRLSDWKAIRFPAWPVDVTVDALMERAMAQSLRNHETDAIPFVWFWPDGANSAAMMTHDVEGRKGSAFVSALMDIDDAFGIKSAFQVVPDLRPDLSERLVDTIRSRGFEVNIHDLNHDGLLFQDRQQFESRALRINQYARDLKCRGFRSGAMYREPGWYDALDFSYDMSMPNVAHLEAQRGGCCTVMPYFIGRTLELPLTTIQDYSLFHILKDYSTTLWRKQIDLVRSRHGLVSFIVHPDYIREKRALGVYQDLLGELSRLRAEDAVWIALPGALDQWWRSRSHMSIVDNGGVLRIEGPDSHRATIAYALLEGDRVVYRRHRA